MYINYLNQFLKHSNLLKCIIRKHIHNQNEFEDVYHNVFIKGLRHYKKLKKQKNFKNWICKIAKVETFKSYKTFAREFKKRYEKEKLLKVIKDPYIKIDDRILVKEALQIIDAKDLKILELYYYRNYKYREIAEILGININTVKTRLRRARRRLEDIIGEID